MSREKVYVVDEDDNVIGEKWRDELLDSDCWRVISVWVTDNTGEVLLQQRSMNKIIGPGVWSAACEGTVEKDHTYADTALRELKEEIGIHVNPQQLVKTTKIHYKDPQFGWRIKQGYKISIQHADEESFVIQKEEVEQVKWLSLSEIDNFYQKSPEKFPLYNEYQLLKFI